MIKQKAHVARLREPGGQERSGGEGGEGPPAAAAEDELVELVDDKTRLLEQLFSLDVYKTRHL